MAMSLDTWVSIGSLVAVAITLYLVLARRFDRLETRVEKLDDRVYALGVGMRPLIDEAQSRRDA